MTRGCISQGFTATDLRLMQHSLVIKPQDFFSLCSRSKQLYEHPLHCILYMWPVWLYSVHSTFLFCDALYPRLSAVVSLLPPDCIQGICCIVIISLLTKVIMETHWTLIKFHSRKRCWPTLREFLEQVVGVSLCLWSGTFSREQGRDAQELYKSLVKFFSHVPISFLPAPSYSDLCGWRHRFDKNISDTAINVYYNYNRITYLLSIFYVLNAWFYFSLSLRVFSLILSSCPYSLRTSCTIPRFYNVIHTFSLGEKFWCTKEHCSMSKRI